MHFPSPSPFVAERSSPEKKDVLQLLLDGHEQIRRCTALAVQLGHAQDASPAEVSAMAARVTRYFTLELPVHTGDEDYALMPRLFTTTLSQEVIELLWELGRQHEEIEGLVERLVPSWVAVRDAPEQYAELAVRLAAGGRQLLTQMEEHLAMEEQLLFPLVRARFSRAMLVELATEIQVRRSRVM